MVDFSDWVEYDGLSEGSGRSEKIWLKNPVDDRVGLFKFTKSDTTTEHVSEKIAELLATKLGIKCAHVDIGTYHGRKGSMSYQINKDGEDLIEGITLITRYYPSYDQDRLFDYEHKEYYSLEMIFRAVDEYNLKDALLKIMIFDSIIGNTDRHHSNWAILKRHTETMISPLYDNGSSLCFCLTEEQVKSYLGNDKMRFNSLVDSKSTSRIRIDKYVRKEPRHSLVLRFINDNLMTETLRAWMQIVIDALESEYIKEVLNVYVGNEISSERAELIYRFICRKVSLLEKIFLGKEE